MQRVLKLSKETLGRTLKYFPISKDIERGKNDLLL